MWYELCPHKINIEVPSPLIMTFLERVFADVVNIRLYSTSVGPSPK